MITENVDALTKSLSLSFHISSKLAATLVKFFDIECEKTKKYHFMTIAAKVARRIIADFPKENDFTVHIKFLSTFVKERKLLLRKQKKARKKAEKAAEQPIQQILPCIGKCRTKARILSGFGDHDNDA